MESIDKIYARAADRKGGEQALTCLLGEGCNDNALAKMTDDRLLSAFTKKVFQSGFVWHP